MDSHKKCILIIDDALVNRLLLRRILSSTYEVLEACDGEEALQLLRRAPATVSAILLDLVMPKMDGFTFLNYLRNTPELAELPVIALTGADSENLEVRALEAGANDFLEKPFRPDVILKRLANTLLLQEALIEARTDALTGLYNRTAFAKYTEHYIVQDENAGKIAALMLIDIDNFKQANDTMGHAYGDHILMVFSEILTEAAGRHALVGRLGGDEFIVLLKDIDSLTFAEKVAADILYRLETSSKSQHPLTCSIGISVFPQDGTTRRQLYFCADEAMYRAKQLGKNQFALYGGHSTLSQRYSWMRKDWILDELDSMIYICDLQTHELCYMNRKASEKIKQASCGAKCLCFMAGLSAKPFTFCTSFSGSCDGTFNGIRQTIDGKQLYCQSHLVDWNGRRAHMTVITELKDNQL